MHLIINKWVITVKVSNFSVQYLRNHRTLDIGVLGYIGIVWPKEHTAEVRFFPPGTPCIYIYLFIYYLFIYLFICIYSWYLLVQIYNLDLPWWVSDFTDMWTDNIKKATQISFFHRSNSSCNSTLHFRFEYCCEDYHGSLMIIFYQATRRHGPERSNLVTVIVTSHLKVRDCWQFPFMVRNFCSWCRIIKWHKIHELWVGCVNKRKEFVRKKFWCNLLISNVVKTDRNILKFQGCDIEKDSNDQNLMHTFYKFPVKVVYSFFLLYISL